MDFAEHAARSRGFDGFSYGDMAEAIGIRKASIHHHFPTKANLSEALIERYQNNLQHRLAEIEATHATAGARLKALIALYRAALDDGRTVCLCVAFSTSRESLSEVVIARVSAVRAMIHPVTAALQEVPDIGGDVVLVLDHQHLLAARQQPGAQQRADAAIADHDHLRCRLRTAQAHGQQRCAKAAYTWEYLHRSCLLPVPEGPVFLLL
mgnify:CR=1 FL=1